MNKKIMTKKEESFVKRNMGIAEALACRFYASARKRCGCVPALEDLKQSAYLALCEASLVYDESRGVEFSTFAFPLVRKRLQEEVKYYLGGFEREEEAVEETADVSYEADYAMVRAEEAGALMAAVERLTPREQTVITELYGLKGKKKGVKELSLHLGLTPSQIYKTEQKALRKLGCLLENTICFF